MNATEQHLRKELHIPDSAPQVIILCSTAHLDWDWLDTFAQYYSIGIDGQYSPVREIFQNAAQYLQSDKTNGSPYYYSIAEIGYLQEFASDQSSAFQALQQVGWLLRIVGGGITSPDNLLSHGETLIRNFLVGNTWVLEQFPANVQQALPPLPPLRQVWVPDDFGHDSQFPIIVEAMGLQGVGFSRIPGDPQQYWTFNNTSLPSGISGGAEIAASLLVFGDQTGNNKGVDFIWQAADGSTALAHFMQACYFQGQNITGSDAQTQIEQCLSMNQGASPTPYVFIPVGVDFSLPVPDLTTSAQTWNANHQTSPRSFAVAATFDHYMQLVNCYRDTLLTRSNHPDPVNNIFSFVPTPYWTGFFASRPAIKILHQQATRTLLGAEIFSVINDLLFAEDSSPTFGSNAAELEAGWQALTPSTHHDYITGTADNGVYQQEQLSYLNNALNISSSVLTAAQQNIAAHMTVSPNADQIAVTIFNQLSFARGGLVEMEAVAGFTPVAFGDESEVLGPVQVSSDGTWLFCIPSDSAAAVPALGYHAYYLTSDSTVTVPSYTTPATSQQTAIGQPISLSNGYLSVTMTDEAGWGIAHFSQFVDGTAQTVLQGSANQAIYFEDAYQDGMYRFATEYGQTFTTTPSDFTSSTVQIVESGPVRTRIQINGGYTAATGLEQLTREYFLVVDEPFLRMKTTGAAPNPYSVFVTFPFVSADDPSSIDTLAHGTPYHWDSKPAQPLANEYNRWVPPTFAATHQFVIPVSGGSQLGALYHSHMPAWAISEDGKALIGCLLRNPNNDKSSGDPPGDPDSHTLEYALRIPNGLADPTTGIPLSESLSYQTPLVAQLASGHASTSLPLSFGLATISDSRFSITAVKAGIVPGQTDGAIILRIYQPTNAGQTVTLTLPSAPAGQQWTAQGVTALETELDPAKRSTLDLQVNSNQITFFAERALTTLAVRLQQSS